MFVHAIDKTLHPTMYLLIHLLTLVLILLLPSLHPTMYLLIQGMQPLQPDNL